MSDRDRQTETDRKNQADKVYIEVYIEVYIQKQRSYYAMIENTNENRVAFYECISTDILAQTRISLLSTVEVEVTLEHRLKLLKQPTTQIQNRKQTRVGRGGTLVKSMTLNQR